VAPFSLPIEVMSLLTASIAGVALRTSATEPVSSLAHSLLFPDHVGAVLVVLALVALVTLARWLGRGGPAVH
jgi:hypothetical protein